MGEGNKCKICNKCNIYNIVWSELVGTQGKTGNYFRVGVNSLVLLRRPSRFIKSYILLKGLLVNL